MQNLLLTKKDLAKQCQVSTRTLEDWVKRRKIPALYLSKRCIRFRADQVMEALAKLERKAIS